MLGYFGNIHTCILPISNSDEVFTDNKSHSFFRGNVYTNVWQKMWPVENKEYTQRNRQIKVKMHEIGTIDFQNLHMEMHTPSQLHTI